MYFRQKSLLNSMYSCQGRIRSPDSSGTRPSSPYCINKTELKIRQPRTRGSMPSLFLWRIIGLRRFKIRLKWEFGRLGNPRTTSSLPLTVYTRVAMLIRGSNLLARKHRSEQKRRQSFLQSYSCLEVSLDGWKPSQDRVSVHEVKEPRGLKVL